MEHVNPHMFSWVRKVWFSVMQKLGGLCCCDPQFLGARDLTGFKQRMSNVSSLRISGMEPQGTSLCLSQWWSPYTKLSRVFWSKKLCWPPYLTFSSLLFVCCCLFVSYCLLFVLGDWPFWDQVAHGQGFPSPVSHGEPRCFFEPGVSQDDGSIQVS